MPTRLSAGPLQVTSLDLTSVNYMLQQVRRELDEIKGLRGTSVIHNDLTVVGEVTSNTTITHPTLPAAGLNWIDSGHVYSGFSEVVAGFEATTHAAKIFGVTGTAGSVVLSNSPTILTPTIASFVNATHTHQNSAGGGTLDHGLALTGLADDDHNAYLLASSATSRAFFAASWIDLTDGGASTLHSHAAGAGSITGSGSAGRVAFWDGAASLSSDADLTFSTATLTASILNMPTTTSGVGQFQINSTLFMHSFGTSNTFLGEGAGNLTLSGAGWNVGLGTNALAALTSGDFNTCLGRIAGELISSGSRNVCVGSNAGSGLTTGNNNILIGTVAGSSLSGASDIIAIGDNVIPSATTILATVAIGSSALASLTTGDYNTAIGTEALYSLTTAQYNTAIGRVALSSTTGEGNTGIGLNAGNANTTGANNTYIGNQADASTGALSGSTAIGYTAIVASSNYIMLGTATECVGIAGAAKPTGTGGLIFPDGTILSSMASNTAGLYANDVGGTVQMFAINEAGTAQALTGSDPYTQYALLAGRAAGQTLIGGTGVADPLILRSTSGVASTGADIIFQGGTNGALELMRVDGDTGFLGIGTGAGPSWKLQVNGHEPTLVLQNTTSAADDLFLMQVVGGATKFTASWNSSGANEDFIFVPTTAAGGQTTTLRVSYTNNIVIGTATPPSTGNFGLIFTDGTALSSMASNTAGLYADDVGGTVNMFAINEAGVVTQLTGGFNGTVTPVTSITCVNGFVTAVA